MTPSMKTIITIRSFRDAVEVRLGDTKPTEIIYDRFRFTIIKSRAVCFADVGVPASCLFLSGLQF